LPSQTWSHGALHKRQAPRSFDSVVAEVLQFLAEAKEALSPPYHSPFLEPRISSGFENEISTFNSTAPQTSNLTTYAVKAGDALSLIAAKFGTTVAALENANPEVALEDLQIGEDVIVPGGFAGVGNANAIGNETMAIDVTSEY
jgi:LysM repeat protein